MHFHLNLHLLHFMICTNFITYSHKLASLSLSLSLYWVCEFVYILMLIVFTAFALSLSLFPSLLAAVAFRLHWCHISFCCYLLRTLTHTHLHNKQLGTHFQWLAHHCAAWLLSDTVRYLACALMLTRHVAGHRWWALSKMQSMFKCAHK